MYRILSNNVIQYQWLNYSQSHSRMTEKTIKSPKWKNTAINVICSVNSVKKNFLLHQYFVSRGGYYTRDIPSAKFLRLYNLTHLKWCFSGLSRDIFGRLNWKNDIYLYFLSIYLPWSLNEWMRWVQLRKINQNASAKSYWIILFFKIEISMLVAIFPYIQQAAWQSSHTHKPQYASTKYCVCCFPFYTFASHKWFFSSVRHR